MPAGALRVVGCQQRGTAPHDSTRLLCVPAAREITVTIVWWLLHVLSLMLLLLMFRAVLGLTHPVVE